MQTFTLAWGEMQRRATIRDMPEPFQFLVEQDADQVG